MLLPSGFMMKNSNKKRATNAKSMLKWAWEFSKRLVIACTLIYAAEQLYACVAMWAFSDMSYLGTMMEQSSEILRTCVFGYLVKAGIENAIKIKGGKKFQPDESPDDEEVSG